VPPTVVAVISTVPAVWAGATTEQLVEVVHDTPAGAAAVVPKDTVVAPVTKPVPVTSTGVPP